MHQPNILENFRRKQEFVCYFRMMIKLKLMYAGENII
jgi:hypothetical protein